MFWWTGRCTASLLYAKRRSQSADAETAVTSAPRKAIELVIAEGRSEKHHLNEMSSWRDKCARLGGSSEEQTQNLKELSPKLPRLCQLCQIPNCVSFLLVSRNADKLRFTGNKKDNKHFLLFLRRKLDTRFVAHPDLHTQFHLFSPNSCLKSS